MTRAEDRYCDNLVIRCMDFRFHARLAELLAQHFGVERFECDSLAGCGGSKAIIDEQWRAVIFQALDLAVPLHRVRRVIIVDHVDCGAYGGSGKFGDRRDEAQFHAERLREAREIVHRSYPQLEVALFYQDRDGITPVE